jgi:hypothetical protein
MLRHVTAAAVERATRRAPWALGDDWLYERCRAQPRHTDPEVVWAKVAHIGRVYAAAIERRRIHRHLSNDAFYATHVVPKMMESDIDACIARAKRQRPGTLAAQRVAVEVHGEVMRLFKKISGLDKRSLASKYLHFHVPALFYIYDSRAAAAMREIGVDAPPVKARRADLAYAKFFAQCAALVACEAQLTPRDVDNLLLKIADRHVGRRVAAAPPAR